VRPSTPSAPAPPPAARATLADPIGTAKVGASLAAPKPRGTVLSYQWQACRGTRCRDVAGATRATLRLRPALVGQRLRVAIRVRAAGRVTRLVSPPSAAVRR
jgi:hypothetical protein